MQVTQEQATQAPPKKTRDLIFISYRRDDAAGVAELLYDDLCQRFGDERVFMDVHNIAPGIVFPKNIKEKVASCAAMLVLIGPHWLNCSADGGRRDRSIVGLSLRWIASLLSTGSRRDRSVVGSRRLDDPEDFVRIEIAIALADKETRVIPVLFKDAVMPVEDDLPDVLKPLAFREAHELNNHFDTKELLDELEKILPPRPPPPPLGFWERLKGYWKLFPVRLIAGMLILAAALAAQLFLAYRPEPIRLEETGLFSPAAVKFGGEVLKIASPVADEEGLLLEHVANDNEVVDFACERAVLDGNTHMLYGEQYPPTTPSRASLLTTSSGSPAPGEPCRTFVKVRADAQRPPSALYLYQQGAPGGDIMRSLEMKADGEVVVSVETFTADGSEETSPGCEKLLRVAPDFETPVSGESPIGVVAAAASLISFSFSPARLNGPPLFAAGGGLFPPFFFSGNGKLRARAVEVLAQDATGKPLSTVLAAHSINGGEPLSVESLSVGSDRLELKVSGVGLVKVKGRNFADPLGRISRHPLLALLLAVADAALLAWLIHFLFGSRPPSDVSVEASPPRRSLA